MLDFYPPFSIRTQCSGRLIVNSDTTSVLCNKSELFYLIKRMGNSREKKPFIKSRAVCSENANVSPAVFQLNQHAREQRCLCSLVSFSSFGAFFNVKLWDISLDILVFVIFNKPNISDLIMILPNSCLMKLNLLKTKIYRMKNKILSYCQRVCVKQLQD